MSAQGMSEIGSNAWSCVSFIPFVVGLILKEYKFVGFVIGAVVAEVRHQIKL